MAYLAEGFVDGIPQIVNEDVSALEPDPYFQAATDASRFTYEHAVPGGWPRDYFPETLRPQMRMISGTAQLAFNACVMRPFASGLVPDSR